MKTYLKEKLIRSLERREFIAYLSKLSLGTVAILKGGLVTSSELQKSKNIRQELDFTLPGKLGNPEMTMLDDPRLDPRIRDSYIDNPVLPKPPPVELTINPTYEDSIAMTHWMDDMLKMKHAQQESNMPPFDDITSYSEVIEGQVGNKITLYIDRPKNVADKIPCLIHFHGGGMSFSSAEAPLFVRWRKSLAQQGMLVIGVEFSSEALSPGHHPFPAGLNDCASAVRWAHGNRAKLDISSIVITGESGGGNLVIATAIKANKEGWINEIDGVYALAPMILGIYGPDLPPGLSSWRENYGYMGNRPIVRMLTKVYDPKDEHEKNPLAWPFHAKDKDLRGLPPHIIVNYELDLIRDDGVVYAQKLRASGVEATSTIINGADHVPEIAMPDTIPELTRNTLASITAFARGVQPQN